MLNIGAHSSILQDVDIFVEHFTTSVDVSDHEYLVFRVEVLGKDFSQF
jgi:hypothetical protein